MRTSGRGRRRRRSSAEKHRPHNQMEMDFNSYRYSHSLRSQKRSLSPRRLDDSCRMERLDERCDFIERREYCRGMGLVGHDGPYEQKSPSYRRMAKRPHLDEEVGNRGYRNPINYEQEQLEPRDDNFFDGESSYPKNIYRNEHDDYRLTYGNEVNRNSKRSPTSLNMKKDKKSWMGDTTMGESYQPYQDAGSTLYYGKGSIQAPTSLNVDRELSGHERVKYSGQVASEKLTMVESHEHKEHSVFNSSEPLDHRVKGFDFRGMRNSNEISEVRRSSSKLAGNKSLGPYQAREMVGSSHDFSRRCDEYDPTECMGFEVCDQRPVDSVIDSDERNRSANYHQRGVFSPKNEYEDYFYSKLRRTTNNAHEYAQGSSNKRTPLYTEMDFSLEHREDGYATLPNPIIMDTTRERQKDIAGSYASLRRGSMMEGHPTLIRNSISDYTDLGRASIPAEQDGQLINAPDDHVGVVGRVPQDYRMSHLDDSRYFRVSNMKTEYEYGREEKLKFQEEKFHEELSSHPVSMYEPNRRNIDWLQTREGYDSYKQADRTNLLGSKYNYEKEIKTTNYRIPTSSGYDASREYQDLYSNDEDIRVMDSTRETRFKNDKSRFSKRICDQSEAFQFDDLLPSQEYYRHKQVQSSEAHKAHKNQTRLMKDNPRHGSLSGNSIERRNRHDKHRLVWERIEYYHDQVHENEYDDDQLEERNGPADPPENSEEFMQMVLDAFLKYSKQLNMKASTRKRFKGQGKSGSLYCIVCGLSLSKEFMDTQSLLRHAFMSRKTGLTAQHLGLLRAVCVMLGWNFDVPQNVVTWTPEVLPSAEALAQKEDLIIWPPIVVVRNISLLDNSSDNWKLVTTEALEALLRSKGFIRGSVKVCLGRPADQSVVVVKFIGTFSGLGDAERIHHYFEQNKRGRVEFEKRTNGGRKNNNSVVMNEREKMEEEVLFGYMGIAEDLQEVDFKTNSSSVIKSKKEIHDWANAPIKPDER